MDSTSQNTALKTNILLRRRLPYLYFAVTLNVSHDISKYKAKTTQIKIEFDCDNCSDRPAITLGPSELDTVSFV